MTHNVFGGTLNLAQSNPIDLTPHDVYGQRLDLPQMVERQSLRDGNTLYLLFAIHRR